jgi:hypothetical protein
MRKLSFGHKATLRTLLIGAPMLGGGLALGFTLAAGGGETSASVLTPAPGWLQSSVAQQLADLGPTSQASSSSSADGSTGELVHYTEISKPIYWQAIGAADDGALGSNPTVWFVVVTGSTEYTDGNAFMSPGASPPSGNTIEMVFDASSQKMTDFGITPDSDSEMVDSSTLTVPGAMWGTYRLSPGS